MRPLHSCYKVHGVTPLRLVEERVLRHDQAPPPPHPELEITPIWSWTGQVLGGGNAPLELTLGDSPPPPPPPHGPDRRKRQRQRKVKCLNWCSNTHHTPTPNTHIIIGYYYTITTIISLLPVQCCSVFLCVVQTSQ